MNTSETSIAIAIVNDGEFEGNEQLFVRLSTSDSSVTLTPVQATIRIVDDDRKAVIIPVVIYH